MISGASNCGFLPQWTRLKAPNAPIPTSPYRVDNCTCCLSEPNDNRSEKLVTVLATALGVRVVRLLLADSTRSRMSASRIVTRPQTNVGSRRPRVKLGPAPDHTNQRGTRRRPGKTARSRRGPHEKLRLALASAVAAWRESGAGEGNRTHVTGPVPHARSTTYVRRRSCV